MHPSDDEIIECVQRGERELFLELFDRYYSRLEQYARRLLKDEETACDLASETLLRAYRSVDSFRVGERISYPGYLFLICRRLILTEQERLRSSPIVPLEDEATTAAAHLADTAPLPLALLLDEERRTMIRAALEKLSEDDHEIILLAFERDLSRRDIMHILGKPSVSAVTSHLHRAMQKLKAVLVQQGYFIAAPKPERE